MEKIPVLSYSTKNIQGFAIVGGRELILAASSSRTGLLW